MDCNDYFIERAQSQNASPESLDKLNAELKKLDS